MESDIIKIQQDIISDFMLYDDWMEYQGIQMTLKDLGNRILEIRRGDFSFA